MFVILIALLTVFLDIVSKYLTLQLLIPAGGEVVVIPYVLNFCYVENRGAAFGILKDHRWVFMTVSIILIALLIVMLKNTNITHKLFLTSVAMILGGGIGNMIDRIFVGYVVDFLKVTFIDFPVFNIADSAVVVGTALLALYFIFFDKSAKYQGEK